MTGTESDEDRRRHHIEGVRERIEGAGATLLALDPLHERSGTVDDQHELGRVGFAPDPGVPFREFNRPQPVLSSGTMPVIDEAAFRPEG